MMICVRMSETLLMESERVRMVEWVIYPELSVAGIDW